MDEAQVRAFVEEYKDLIRSAANEAEVRSRFETAAISDQRIELTAQNVANNFGPTSAVA